MFLGSRNQWMVVFQLLHNAPSSVCRKQKDHQFDNIVITGGAVSCHNDNLQCNQWQQSRQIDDLLFSVHAAQLKIVTTTTRVNINKNKKILCKSEMVDNITLTKYCIWQAHHGMVKHKSDNSETHKRYPVSCLTGEQWGIYCEPLGEHWMCCDDETQLFFF